MVMTSYIYCTCTFHLQVGQSVGVTYVDKYDGKFSDNLKYFLPGNVFFDKD